MEQPTKNSSNKPNLEDLLRFKRSERPDEDFWEEFDGELHQRMMQALVKKDPWHVQLIRGLTGRVAQISAISAAAAVLAFMALPPVLVTEEEKSRSSLVEAETDVIDNTEQVPSEIDAAQLAGADYEIETLKASASEDNAAITRDFSLDHIEVASYTSEAYSADMALPGFTSTGVASLVY